jgi:hypothetical protein
MQAVLLPKSIRVVALCNAVESRVDAGGLEVYRQSRQPSGEVLGG